jgi:flagellar motor switch protein FliM
MSEQILSQEEIDALLSAMSKGEVDLDAGQVETPDVQTYDLMTKSKMLQEQFYALEEVNDKLTNRLKKSISSTLQRAVEVKPGTMEMVTYAEFIKVFPTRSIFSIFTMEPLVGSALLAIESELAFSLIDCMFGGTGKPLSWERDFTLIEKRLMKKFSLEIMSNMEQAWEEVCSITNRFKKLETKPEFLHLVEPGDIVLVILFSLDGGEFIGNIHFCIPYLILESIKNKLSLRYMVGKDMEHSWNDRIQELLADTRLTLTAELGRTHQTVRDIISLQVDDVLKLSTGPQDLITLNVEGVPKYQSFPGVVKGNRAVQITELINIDRGLSGDG